MLADPFTVAADSPTPALSFALVNAGNLASNRWDTVNGYKLNFTHSNDVNKGEKHYVQLQQTVSATNPLTGGASYQTASVSISVSIPPYGWTQAQKAALIKALCTDILAGVTINGLLTYQM